METATHEPTADEPAPGVPPVRGSDDTGSELPEPDPDALEAFADRFVEAINQAGVMLMVSVGHRTGLFEVLADGRPRTSEELASEAGLNERYVREWLAALATGGVVELDDDDRYRLPPERAALLTWAGEGENLAAFAQYIPLLGSVEDEIVECFREGGGVPYERFDRFHQIMSEDSAQTVLAGLHDDILPLVPDVKERLEDGIRMLDVGCGRGLALLELAGRYPESEFVGYDLSEEAVGFARRTADDAGLENVRFEVRDVSDFDRTAEPDAFDFVTTFDAIHDQKDPAAVLRGIARTLRADGVYLMQDIRASSHVSDNLDHPLGPFLYTISCMHCMTVSLAQDGAGLGTMWGRERATSMLRDAGFESVEVHQLAHDIQNDFYVVRP